MTAKKKQPDPFLITVEKLPRFGRVDYVPKNMIAKRFAELLEVKSFTEEQVTLMRELLGYTVEFVKDV